MHQLTGVLCPCWCASTDWSVVPLLLCSVCPSSRMFLRMLKSLNGLGWRWLTYMWLAASLTWRR
jgi:hypothetical protein